MAMTLNSLIDSDLLYGLRTNKAIAFCFLIFSRLSMCLHGLCLVTAAAQLSLADSAPIPVPGAIPNDLVITTVILSMISLISNRMTMYFGLRTLAGIELAISDSRTHQWRRWQGLILYLAPLSLLMPPGDLLAVAMYLLLIRANTDHLSCQQGILFSRAEFGLAVGAMAQYFGLTTFVAAVYLYRFPFAITHQSVHAALVGNVFLLLGVVLVDWSISRMQSEVSRIVRHSEFIQDSAVPFLAGLSSTER